MADCFQGTGIGLSGSPIVSHTQVLLNDLSIPCSNLEDFFPLVFQGLIYTNIFAKQFHAGNCRLTKG
jgi:hypothetical protein